MCSIMQSTHLTIDHRPSTIDRQYYFCLRNWKFKFEVQAAQTLATLQRFNGSSESLVYSIYHTLTKRFCSSEVAARRGRLYSRKRPLFSTTRVSELATRKSLCTRNDNIAGTLSDNSTNFHSYLILFFLFSLSFSTYSLFPFLLLCLSLFLSSLIFFIFSIPFSLLIFSTSQLFPAAVTVSITGFQV